jgi:DNA-binding response OmpR family regulator
MEAGLMSALNDAGLRILVIEDDADCAESTALLLRLWGHQVEVVRDGAAALQAAQACLPDVLLLDLGLPEMIGYDVARRLREQPEPKRPFVIALTGFGRQENRRRSAESGIDLHMLKPVDPGRLKMLLARFQGILRATSLV